jgi:hypothetical protein
VTDACKRRDERGIHFPNCGCRRKHRRGGRRLTIPDNDFHLSKSVCRERHAAAGNYPYRGTARFIGDSPREKAVADELQDEIRKNAEGPAKVSGDAGSVEQHKLSEQVAADKYLASKEAAKSKRRGLRFNKFIPPGTA